MALRFFLNDLMISSQHGEEESSIFSRSPLLEIVVIDDNARPILSKRSLSIMRSASPAVRDSMESQSSSDKKENRWGHLSKQQSDPCVFSPVVVFTSSSSLSSSERRPRAPRKTKSDDSLVIPQRVASPSMLQTARKRIRKQLTMNNDAKDDSISRPITLLSASAITASSTICSDDNESRVAPPPLPLRFKSPMVQQDSRRKTIPTSSTNKRPTVLVPKLTLRTPSSKARSAEGSISIIDEVNAILALRDDSFVVSPPAHNQLVQKIERHEQSPKLDRYTKSSRISNPLRASN
jgi:hypothetical protein